MSETVIKVENLSKQYRLGLIGTGTLIRDIQSWWARRQGKEDPNSLITEDGVTVSGDRIWALRDFDFEAKQGEVIGIIGKNGAGKFTLLKILSKLTMLISGIVRLKGRVASLNGIRPIMNHQQLDFFLLGIGQILILFSSNIFIISCYEKNCTMFSKFALA